MRLKDMKDSPNEKKKRRNKRKNELKNLRYLFWLNDTNFSCFLRPQKEDEFEHIFLIQLPDRPEIVNREEPVNFETWNRFRLDDGRFRGVVLWSKNFSTFFSSKTFFRLSIFGLNCDRF